MTARSSHALLASIMLHGVFIALMLVAAYLLRDETVNTKIMELVAGAGDNYGATEAPALGNPDSTNSAPAIEAPAGLPPVATQEMEAISAPIAPAKPVAKTPDFAKQVARVADRVEAKQMKKFDQQQKALAEAQAKADAAKAKEDLAKNRMTKEEFDKRYGKQLAANARTAPAGAAGSKISKIDAKGIAAGVVGGSTANTKGGAGGTAMSREEGDRLDAYFSMLVQRLKSAHERPAGVSDLLTAKAEFYIAHDGTISRVKIVRTSGSPEFDQSVLSAFRNVDSIGPRPDDGGTLRREVTFKMKDE